MDLLSAPATPLQSSSSAFNPSDSVQDLLGVTTNNLGASTIITVNSIADVVDNNDGVTTLREAINFANADTGDDVIVFDSSLFATPQTISLSLGELNITHNLSIIAPRDSLTGGDLLTVSGNNAMLVFEIGSGATVNISGLVIADGLVTNEDGGGIKNSGILTLDSSIVRNDSTRYGGSIYNKDSGIVNVSNSTLNGNTGSGIFNKDSGTVNVSNSTLNSNMNSGISNTGTGIVKVSNSTISGNTAAGIDNYYVPELGPSKTTVVVNNTTISDNSGGGIYSNQSDLGSIFEVSNSTISGNSKSGIYKYGPFKLSNSTISGNSASSGGGIANYGSIEVSNSTISGNSASFGGGFYNYAGTVNVSNSTISGNTSNGDGGGIGNSYGTLNVSNSTISGNTSNGNGGGINNLSTLNVSNSTISGNTSGNNGGGIFNDNDPNSYTNYQSTVEVSNSTISGNTSGNNGGGIFNRGNLRNGDPNNAIVTINNSTLTLNQAANGGGVFNFTPGSTRVRNTIIASNLKSENGLNPDVAGRFISDGYNLIGDRTSSSGFKATGDIVGTSDNPIDPRLGPLSANGGPTQTHALLEDSPAIDAGDPTVLDTDPITDQRGFPRVSGARADIGAFEFSLIV